MDVKGPRYLRSHGAAWFHNRFAGTIWAPYGMAYCGCIMGPPACRRRRLSTWCARMRCLCFENVPAIGIIGGAPRWAMPPASTRRARKECVGCTPTAVQTAVPGSHPGKRTWRHVHLHLLTLRPWLLTRTRAAAARPWTALALRELLVVLRHPSCVWASTIYIYSATIVGLTSLKI